MYFKYFSTEKNKFIVFPLLEILVLIMIIANTDDSGVLSTQARDIN